MNVLELIEELKHRPMAAKVMILGNDGCVQEAEGVSPPYQDNPFRNDSEYRVDIR